MTIWIDPPAWPAHGRLWSHLISDTGLDELHAFAASCGIPRRGFEGDHYDVPQEHYAAAVAAGAVQTSGPDLLRRLQASGLRLRKRKGERGIAKIHGVRFPDGTVADVDFVASRREPPDTGVFASLVFLADADDHWLLVYSRRRGEWSAPSGWREPGERAAETVCREVREETGLALEPGQLTPVAYERFYPHDPDAWPVPGRFMAVYRARLSERRPSLAAQDGEPARWATRADFLETAAASWWLPMAQAVLGAA